MLYSKVILKDFYFILKLFTELAVLKFTLLLLVAHYLISFYPRVTVIMHDKQEIKWNDIHKKMHTHTHCITCCICSVED